MKAPGRDLDQPLVKAGVRALAVGHPALLPCFVCIPVPAAVKEVDAVLKTGAHGDNRRVAHPPAEYSRVNLSSDPIYRYLRITKGGPGGVAGQASEQDLVDAAWMQPLRRIHQLQSAWWVFATGEHSRLQHALGSLHLAGAWARRLYPPLTAPAEAPPSAPPLHHTP